MDSKISNLNTATILTDSDVLPIVNGAETKKTTLLLIYNYLKAKFDLVYTTTSEVATQITTALNGYATQSYVNSQGFITNVFTALGFTPENLANKQSDLTASSTKYPTVNAVVNGLVTKQDTLISGINIKTVEGQSILGAGNIDITKIDVGLSNVDNISDANKPISTATQTALNAKENSIQAGITSQYYRGDKTFQTLDKTAVGLPNVDNTSDVNKPISTATQTALNAKQNTITNSDSITQGSTNLFLTSAERTKLTNTTNVNSGDETSATILSKLGYNPIKTVIRDAVQGSTVTGVTTETLTGTYFIPANTYSANDIMRIAAYTAEKTGIVGTATMRVKVGSSATFGSATTIATYTISGTNLSATVVRSALTLRGGNIRALAPTSSNLSDIVVTNAGFSNVSFNPAVDNYIFTSLQLSVGTDSAFQSNFLLTN